MCVYTQTAVGVTMARVTTVLMGFRKAIFLKIHSFHVLTKPLGRKFHTYSKNDLKKFYTISEGYELFD